MRHLFRPSLLIVVLCCVAVQFAVLARRALSQDSCYCNSVVQDMCDETLVDPHDDPCFFRADTTDCPGTHWEWLMDSFFTSPQATDTRVDPAGRAPCYEVHECVWDDINGSCSWLQPAWPGPMQMDIWEEHNCGRPCDPIA
jgi:hypothetical protein